MNKLFKKWIMYLILFIMPSSCGNILEDTANKNSDAAILYQARMYLSHGDWSNAITEFNSLTAATLAQTDVKIDLASAYSGRCGLDFITISLNLQNFNPVSSQFFAMVLPSVVTTTNTSVDCVTSETILKTIATNGVVNDPVGQFLMAFNSLAKISAILNYYADVDDNGTVDAAWDACGAGGLADLPNADLNEIVTGFFLFIHNIAGLAVGGALGTNMITQCEAALGVGNCATFDTASVSNAERWFMRGSLVETDDKIGLAVRAGNTALNAADPQCQL